MENKDENKADAEKKTMEMKKENKKPSKEKDKKIDTNKKKEDSTKNKDNYFGRRIATILILIAILAAIIIAALWLNNQQTKEGAVATVNRESIKQEDIDFVYDNLPDIYKASITKEDILQQLIQEKLLLQEAEKKGISVGEDEVDSLVKDIASQNGMTIEEFTTKIEEKGLKLSDIKDSYRKQIRISKLINESVTPKIKVSEEEIEEYYNDNIEQFSAKEGEIRASHILVETEKEAQDIREKVLQGEDFGKLAEEFSIDYGSAQFEGDLGFFSKGMMVKEFEDAAFSLKVGEISDIVKTQFGYHIIKRENDKITIDEVRDRIEANLKTEKESMAVEEYIAQLTKDADIEIIEPEIEDNFEDTGEEVCKENGQVVVKLFTTTGCCSEAKKIMNNLDAKVYSWLLDSGDNLATENIETGISKQDFELYKKYNPDSEVPFILVGCKYKASGELDAELIKEKIAELK